MVIVLLGPPGVGKGTQGKMLAADLDWRHVATGDLLRAHRREDTDLGRKAQGYMDRGELVPDGLIMDMVRDVMRGLDEGEGIVFDGFPRTPDQADGLRDVLDEVGFSLDVVIVLGADDEVIVKRISGRRSCPGCDAVYNVHFNPPETEGVCDRCGSELVHRADDAEDTVLRRLEVYRAETEPLIAYYERSEAPVAFVDGSGSVEAVRRSIRAEVDAVLDDATVGSGGAA